jgi:hypothetical protein
VSSRRYAKDYLKRISGRSQTIARVEAGLNDFTVILRVVGGDEKESLNSGTVNMVASTKGLGP